MLDCPPPFLPSRGIQMTSELDRRIQQYVMGYTVAVQIAYHNLFQLSWDRKVEG